MKRLYYFSFLMLALLLPAYANAHDFVINGIYYAIDIFNANEVYVTFRGAMSDSFHEYSGDVTIPETVSYNGTTYTVTSIGDNAFEECSGLTSIDIPNTVKTIGYAAFEYCSGLTSITIPNSVTYIKEGAFFYCSGLTSINIPNSVTTIDIDAFSYCSGLTSINIESGNQTFDSRDNCNAIIKTANNTLIAGCKNTVIPNSVTSIGTDAFQGCTGLSSITFPNSVTSIGSHAFLGCSGLSSITFPNSVTSIGDYAFINCGGLTDVYCYIANPSLVTTGFNIFSSSNNTQRTLHVPAGSLEAYQAYASWSNYFGNIVEMEPEAVLAESIKLNVTTAGLNEGATLQLTATVLPEGASSESVIWASNNPNVATVDSNGLVTTHSVGTVTITAMTTDGSNLSTSCTVTLLPVGIKGDVNGDDDINISDVTKLIDYLLSGTWN